MFSDVLFELGVEELPSKAVKQLGEALNNEFQASLDRRNLNYAKKPMRIFATPRRIAVFCQVETQQAAQIKTRQGPAYAVSLDSEGHPNSALLGFARSCGVDVSQLVILETEKGKWWTYQQELPGQTLQSLLPDIMQEVLTALPVTKPMRWGTGHSEFARPVHWAVLMINEQCIDLELFGIRTGTMTYGHRFHHPQGIHLKHAADYEEALKLAQVVVDFDIRKNSIHQQLNAVANTVNGDAIVDDALLEEVCSIVEWPIAVLVPYALSFIEEVPHEALIAAMQVHQKCFPVCAKDTLLPYFITIANIDSKAVQSVIQGNARVMRARLSDAAFFYQQDNKVNLNDFVTRLNDVIYQAKLGTMTDKTKRMAELVSFFASYIDFSTEAGLQAVKLCKADLMSAMVNEFPELEGLMGYYYARNQSFSEEIAVAIKEHYFPKFANDQLPESVLGSVISLADRIDTLVGIFGVGLKPTATKDPFKLRRHAAAVLRILMTFISKKPILLTDLLQCAAKAYQPWCSISSAQLDEIQTFMFDRLHGIYQQMGFAPTFLVAVLKSQNQCLFDIHQRMQALEKFSKGDEFQALNAVAKRVSKILQTLPESIQTSDYQINSDLFEKLQEQNLYTALSALEKQATYLQQHDHPMSDDYTEFLIALSDTQAPVAEFFEYVMVFVEDDRLKMNRIALLMKLNRYLQCVCDISLL